MVEYSRFSDFTEETKSFEGDKKKVNDILNQEILVIDYKIKDSKQHKGKQYVTIQFEIDNIVYIVFTGSKVLSNQLEKYKNNIPFYTQIKKINKYYTFT